MYMYSSISFSTSVLINPRKIQTLGIPSTTMSWACKKCTFVNPPSQKGECEICFSPASPSASGPSSSSSPPKWSCKACTFLNPYNNPSCEVCGTRCPVLSLSNLTDLNDATDHDSSVGSVFFPLRTCKKRKAIDDDDDSSEVKVKPSDKATDITGDGKRVSMRFTGFNFCNVRFIFKNFDLICGREY